MSPNTITIPAELVALVRGGAYLELHGALAEASTVIEGLDRENPASPKRCLQVFARIDGARGLLDRLCWTARGEQESAEIDLHHHHPALYGALAERLESERGHLETLGGDDPIRGEAEGRATELRGLLEEIGDAPGDTGERPGERLVLFGLLPGAQRLAGEEPKWWTVAEIEAELSECDSAGVRYAIDGLVAEEVAVRDGERVRASRRAGHIDAMGMLCV
jgi:hypothetical protein